MIQVMVLTPASYAHTSRMLPMARVDEPALVPRAVQLSFFTMGVLTP